MFHSLLFNVTLRPNSCRSSGAYTIATHLREQGWNVEVIDYVSYWPLESLKQLCETRINNDTKFLGFSHLFSIWTENLENLCLWLKKKYPNLYIISGSSGEPHFYSECIDYYISGYGEKAITTLLSYLFSAGPEPKIKYLSDGRRLIDAIHSYPSYPWRYPMIEYEDRDFIEPNEFLCVEFSRGCKFACDFCNFPVLGVKGDYTRNADGFTKQIQSTYDRYGVTNYVVTDETFNDTSEKIQKFADAFENLSFRPWLTGFIRADVMVSRKQDLEHLLRMNFTGHYYGIESFNRETGKMIGKGMDPEKLKQGLLDCRDYFTKHGFFRGTISLITGLPKESDESLNETHDWLVDNWQGQSVQPFAFEIQCDEFTRESKISKDYEKYGYRKLGVYDSLVTNADDILRVSQKAIRWETDTMTFERAVNHSNKIRNSFRLIDNFALALKHCDTDGNILKLEDKIDISWMDSNDLRDNFIQNLQRYIKNKLDYNKKI